MNFSLSSPRGLDYGTITLRKTFIGLPRCPKVSMFPALTVSRSEHLNANLISLRQKPLAVSGVHKTWWIWLQHGPARTKSIYWTDEKELFWSVMLAVVVGVAFSVCANWGVLHRVLRWLRLTKRTSFPSEWYSALHRFNKGELVLHLKSDRRLKGWADEWPDYPDRGHFIIQFPVWLDKLGKP